MARVSAARWRSACSRARVRSRWIVGWLLVLIAGCQREGEPGLAGDSVSERAPGFVLPLLTGGDVALDRLHGRVVILDFWATWCAPCEVQMPILDALYREVSPEELAIVGISVDTDPPASVAAWIDERGFRYPIALGSQSLAVDYGLLGFPSLVVIDAEGWIRARHTGVWSREEIDAVVEFVRKTPRPPAASGG